MKLVELTTKAGNRVLVNMDNVNSILRDANNKAKETYIQFAHADYITVRETLTEIKRKMEKKYVY